MKNKLLRSWTSIKIRTANMAAFIVISLFSLSTNAIDHFSNADNEKEIARQWLEKNQKVPTKALLMKALLSRHYQPASTLLPYLNNEPKSNKRRIIVSLMISQCTDNPQLKYCDGETLEHKLVKLNPNNVFPYLLQFNHSVAQGDMNKALTSLTKALSATEVNDYYFDKVMYLRSELGHLGIYGKGANLLAEEFSGDGLANIYNKIIPTCTEQSITHAEWRSVCLALSDKLEKGNAFLSNVVGAALRRDVLKAASADETKIKEAMARRKFYNTFRENARITLPNWDDPAQKPDSYYTNAVKFGEFRAIQMMLDEVSKASIN